MSRVLIVIALICFVVNTFALKHSRESVLRPFVQGKALKIISGLNNFDTTLVTNVAWAAQFGGASHVDIACDPALVKIAKSVSSIPVCVSSVKPIDFVAAVEAGADMVEIGNFDSFYGQGIKFSVEDIINMTKKTRQLLPSIPLSVTVPHTLALSEQIALAKQLEECGADVIQTEGKMGANPTTMGVQELIETAAPALASAFALSRAVSVPVMCSSGLTDVTAPLALAAGARGVGIGSMVNKLKHQQQMYMAVSAIASAMGRSADNEVVHNADVVVSSSVSQNAKQIV